MLIPPFSLSSDILQPFCFNPLMVILFIAEDTDRRKMGMIYDHDTVDAHCIATSQYIKKLCAVC